MDILEECKRLRRVRMLAWYTDATEDRIVSVDWLALSAQFECDKAEGVKQFPDAQTIAQQIERVRLPKTHPMYAFAESQQESLCL